VRVAIFALCASAFAQAPFRPIATVHVHTACDGDFEFAYSDFSSVTTGNPWEVVITSHMAHVWNGPEFTVSLTGVDGYSGEQKSANFHLNGMCNLIPGKTCTIVTTPDGAKFAIREIKVDLANCRPVPTEDERAAEITRAAKQREDARAMEKAKDAARQERQVKANARAMEEQKKLSAKCHGLFRQTANKKVSDLTVVESRAVQACEAMGMYQ
jgi:hypothetical protein